MADTEALAELLAERDRLRQVTEMQAATIEQQADSIQKIMEQSARRKEFADRLRAQVDAAPNFEPVQPSDAELDALMPRAEAHTGPDAYPLWGRERVRKAMRAALALHNALAERPARETQE